MVLTQNTNINKWNKTVFYQNKYGQLVFLPKVQRKHEHEGIAFSTDGTGKIGYQYAKKKKNP